MSIESRTSIGFRRWSKIFELFQKIHLPRARRRKGRDQRLSGFFDANFVIGNVLSFLCVFVVYYLESLLIEIDFYEIGLESSIILEYNVCAFQAWRSISVWNEGDLHCTAHVLWSSVKFVLFPAKLCTKCLA